MEFESDVVPLIEDVSDGNRDLFLELNAQVIDDPDFEQVNIIYYKIRKVLEENENIFYS